MNAMELLGQLEEYQAQRDLMEMDKRRLLDEVKVPAEVIGKLVMSGLRTTDDVAYVRFASVYRRFQEATDFVHEVKKLEGKQ